MDLSIRMKRQTYEKWLVKQRPFLASLPKSAIIDYDFTTLHDGSKISPVVTYNLKAGQWEGVVELCFTLKIDAKGQPAGISEETVTFVKLPATISVVGEGGKTRNQYDGLKFRQPKDVAVLLKRVADGGDFADYRKQTDESGQFVHSFFDYNDPWKNHQNK